MNDIGSLIAWMGMGNGEDHDFCFKMDYILVEFCIWILTLALI